MNNLPNVQQLAAISSIVPKLGDPTLGVAAGVGAAFFITRKDPKWAPFWLTLAGSFVAIKLASMLSTQGAPVQ